MAAYSLADWDMAMRNPGGSPASDAVSVAKFEQSVKMTGYPWFVALQRDVNAAADNLTALDHLIDERAEKLSPGLNKFRDELLAVEQLVETILAAAPEVARDIGGLAETSDEGDASASLQSTLPGPINGVTPKLALDVTPAAGRPGIRIQTRAEAYSLLEEIALFLYQNDPHSPTPYLISRAVAWGNMHFDELLPELVGNVPNMSDLLKLLNIETPQKSREPLS
jgi:type VI secretion system protein ImpA